MLPSMYPTVFLPARTSIKVVFPAPLTPINAVSTPGRNDPLTPFSSSKRVSSDIVGCAFVNAVVYKKMLFIVLSLLDNGTIVAIMWIGCLVAEFRDHLT
ncbi:hypothetical protein IEQ34_020058 [Dendrobium chrysotoxum]|uniref:Uncharacterized protein n=1 Tax=Dendrobium chrysotoxum TaxID=161865 RepID=A0AAV7FZH8_DENCH|nr:hypothetical protein IEQ34_020058 [Dendrobium chrysotoxum]